MGEGFVVLEIKSTGRIPIEIHGARTEVTKRRQDLHRQVNVVFRESWQNVHHK